MKKRRVERKEICSLKPLFSFKFIYLDLVNCSIRGYSKNE